MCTNEIARINQLINCMFIDVAPNGEAIFLQNSFIVINVRPKEGMKFFRNKVQQVYIGISINRCSVGIPLTWHENEFVKLLLLLELQEGVV